MKIFLKVPLEVHNKEGKSACMLKKKQFLSWLAP